MKKGVSESGKKEETDCVHLISNKHVKGLNIVILSGKIATLSLVLHLWFVLQQTQ